MSGELPNLSSIIRQEPNANWRKWHKIDSPNLEWETKLLSTLGVISAPILTLLVDVHVLAPLIATDIGSIVAAAAVGFHGSVYLQKRKTNATRHSPQRG